MKKYLADILTLSRVLCGLALIVMMIPALTAFAWIAVVVFAFGILTDALDGPAARRWPYAKSVWHWWRTDPKRWDNLADAALFYPASVLVALVWPTWWLVLLGIVIFDLIPGFFIVRAHKEGRISGLADAVSGGFYVVKLYATQVVMTWLAADTRIAPVMLTVLYTGVGAIIVVAKWREWLGKRIPAFSRKPAGGR